MLSQLIAGAKNSLESGFLVLLKVGKVEPRCLNLSARGQKGQQSGKCRKQLTQRSQSLYSETGGRKTAKEISPLRATAAAVTAFCEHVASKL